MIQVDDLPVPQPAPDDIRATVDEIMARAEFNRAEPASAPDAGGNRE